MGNTQSSDSISHSKPTQVKPEQFAKIYEQIPNLLSSLCPNDRFPLSSYQHETNMSLHHRIIEFILEDKQSHEFSNLLIQTIWNNRKSIPKEDVNKLFFDCFMFDLTQALNEDIKNVEVGTCDDECFTTLTNSIEAKTSAEIEQEQFSQWVRVEFPGLFYGFEMWLRKCIKFITTNKTSTKQTPSNRQLMAFTNILNPTWVWLLAHQLPIFYLSADISCTNMFERIASVMYGRMWDHLYDSRRDGSSLNRFQHHIFGYKGPIFILFEISDGYLFCLCCDDEFKESPKQFGGIQTCFLQLKPIYKTVLEGSNIIFMNTKLRAISEPGLFVGRDYKNPFFTIDEDFFNVKHINGHGRLVGIDVWGTGGKKSAEAQEDMRLWEERQIEKSRKVKRSYEEEETILNMAGIETRHTQEQL